VLVHWNDTQVSESAAAKRRIHAESDEMPELTDICLSCTVAMVILALLPGLLLLRLAWDDGASGLFAMRLDQVEAPVEGVVERHLQEHKRAMARLGTVAISKLGSGSGDLGRAVPGWVSPRRLI